MSDKEQNEELRPSKMRGVAFPKSKYGVIAAAMTPYLDLGKATPLILLGLNSSFCSLSLIIFYPKKKGATIK